MWCWVLVQHGWDAVEDCKRQEVIPVLKHHWVTATVAHHLKRMAMHSVDVPSDSPLLFRHSSRPTGLRLRHTIGPILSWGSVPFYNYSIMGPKTLF